MQARYPAVCKEFMEFMKRHEERMRRAERFANEIKGGHDKRKRKLLGELDQTVIFVFLIYAQDVKKTSTFFLNLGKGRSGNLSTPKTRLPEH